MSNRETPIEVRGHTLRPPSSNVWLSASDWIPMQISSRGLRVIFRSPETKRTCEITYKPSTDKWHVRCFITNALTVNFSDMREWPHNEENFEKGIPMLNSYDGLVEALNAFVEWTK